MPKKKKQEKKTTDVKKPANNMLKEKEEIKILKELLPIDQKYWLFLKEKIESFGVDFGFYPVNLPMINPSSFFYKVNKTEQNELKKQIITLSAKSKSDELCLIPDTRPLLIQYYINNKLGNISKVFNFSHFTPIFLREKKRGGDVMQMYQFGFDTIGEDNPVLEAIVLNIAYNIFKELGIDISLNINNMGCKECISEFWNQLEDYYKNRKRYVCEDCKSFYSSKTLEFLNCDKANCQELSSDAPQIIDNLCDDCRESFVKILEFLDDSEIPYTLDSKMIIKPDHYSRTVFSITTAKSEEGEETELIIGGRYDKYFANFSGKPVSAFGFSGIIEKIIPILKRENYKISKMPKIDVFVTQLGDEARKKALKLYQRLREKGIRVANSFWLDGLNPQINLANKLEARFILILGQREIIDKTVLLRDTESGAQEVINYDNIVKEIKKRLINGSVSNHFIDKNILKKNGKDEDEKSFDSEIENVLTDVENDLK